ncbi:HNH endonuclease signature motif containing protein [Streptomyces varsoviensis]|uniref:HNH endonuclease n=1 Tax=Streptomyces varsoviensis TaxID=67373 RepID=UPI0033BFC07D
MAWIGSTRRSRLPRDWSAICRRIKRRDGFRCTTVFYSGERCTQRGTDVDHIIPGDDHSDGNLRLLCRWCHARKSAHEGGTAAAQRRVRASRPRSPHPALED